MIVQFSRCLKKFFSSFIIATLSDSFNIISYFQAFVNTFFEVFSKSFFSLGSSVSAFFRQRSLLYHIFSLLSIPFLNFFKKFFESFNRTVVFIANPLELTCLLYHDYTCLSIVFSKKITFV